MTSTDEDGKPGLAPADHAGSLLCRLLVSHPEVVEGVICYSLGVLLPGGRELYVDVEDADPPWLAGGPG